MSTNQITFGSTTFKKPLIKKEYTVIRFGTTQNNMNVSTKSALTESNKIEMPNSFHLKVQSLYFRELAYIEELKGPRHDLR